MWAVKFLYAAYPPPYLAWPRHLQPTGAARRLRGLHADIGFIRKHSALQRAPSNLQVQLAEGGRNSGSARISALVFPGDCGSGARHVLLAAAGLLIRSFTLLQRVDPGFDSSHLAVVRLSLPDSRYRSFRSELSL
jgi:hypothetical protein